MQVDLTNLISSNLTLDKRDNHSDIENLKDS